MPTKKYFTEEERRQAKLEYNRNYIKSHLEKQRETQKKYYYAHHEEILKRLREKTKKN